MIKLAKSGKENYDTTFTIRISGNLKDKLAKNAESKGIPFSEYIRDILERGKLPEDLLELLPPNYQKRIIDHAIKAGQSPGDVLLRLINMAIPHSLDSRNYGSILSRKD